MADLSVFERLKSKQDYDRMEQEFQLKKQLAQAELKKQSYVDVDKIGEAALFKAAQGIKLTPQENAAARFVNAKGMGIGFDPVTQSVYQKQGIGQRLGLDLGGNGEMQNFDAPSMSIGDIEKSMGGGMQERGRATPPPAPLAFSAESTISSGGDGMNEYDIAYEEAMRSAVGNPKLQQSIKTDYLKSKMEYNENQAKAAGFADRMRTSNPIIEDPDKQKAGQSMSQKALDYIPLLGNYVVSDDYQSFNQAQRDFINAQLRRESGAVINPEEFANARLQYFPQPGDSEEVVLQKQRNRAEAVKAMERSAGPAYKPTGVTPITKKSEIEKNILAAQQAVKKGKDPDAVRQLLIDAGIDPKRAGL